MPGDPLLGGFLRGYGPVILEINDHSYPPSFTLANATRHNDMTNDNMNPTDKNNDIVNVTAKNHNKLMHMTYGNYSDINVVQINSGNGKWATNDALLKASIDKHSPDVIVVSESNINLADNIMVNARRSNFKNYNCIDKVFIGTSNARLSVLVKSNFEFERKVELENDINPTIVINVKTSLRKNHTLVANYRQWKGTAPSCSFNGRIDDHAVKRFIEMTNVWKSALAMNNPTTILGDINIDRLEVNDPVSRQDLKNLIPILKDIQSSHNLVLMNNEPTRFRHGQRPTLLDLVITNSPQNVSNVKNISNFCSEHMGVFCRINIDQVIINQQFRKIRNRINLNSKTLMPLIENNLKLQGIFSTSEPDTIAETLTTEIDNIVESVAPSKIIQIKKKDNLKITGETRNKILEADIAVTKATRTLEQNDFRHAKNLQNEVKKRIKEDETEYLKRNLNNNKKDFRTIKEELETDNKTPTRIIHNGEEIRSQKRIAEIMNKFYVKKVEDIRKNFETETDKAIEVLKSLKTKPTTSFDFKPVDVYTVHEVIEKTKRSNSSGKDTLTANIMKECHQFFSRALCHLFNSMLYHKKFPQNLKTSKLIPILKPNKDPNLTDSYRPIAILQASEKVIEELMRKQMQQYFNENNLIPNQHHGGLQNHSTLSAIASLDHSHKLIKEKRKNTLIMTTDLSAAFDTVDHTVLVKKLKFYGLSNNAAELMTSFLSNRKTFVEIQGFRSKETTTPPCSVVQGSKLSGFLYTIYSIEIPLIPQILRNQQLIETLFEILIPNYYSIDHEVNQFVDDSSNVVGSETEEELGLYTSDYLKIMEKFYYMNKLKLNAEKTKVMITKAKETKKIKISAPNGEVLTPDKAIKILGYWKNSRDNYETHISKITGIVSKRLCEIKPYLSCMNLKTRRKIVYSKIASIILYGIELYLGQTDETLRKVTVLLMKCNKTIYSKDYMRVSNNKICREILVDPPEVLIRKASLKFIHKLINNEKPQQLFNKIRFNNKTRRCTKLSLNDGIRKESNKRTLIYQSIQLYNSIPSSMKYLSIRKFKTHLAKVKDV